MFAQTIKSPTYTRNNARSISLSEIERTQEYTIIRGIYDNGATPGWVNIGNTTYIKDCRTGKEFNIIKTEGLPMSPDKYTTQSNEKVKFAFYFPPIESDIEMIDMIEEENSDQSFNIYGIALKEDMERTFEIKYRKGHSLINRPSLPNRINGVKEIQLYVPKGMNDLEEYIYGNIAYYFQSLGLRVDIVNVEFTESTHQAFSISGTYTSFDGNVSDYVKNANTLSVIVNYARTYGGLSKIYLRFYIVDYINQYIWGKYEIELPNKFEKFYMALQKTITNKYAYNPTYASIPSSIESSWNSTIAKAFIDKHGADSIEGIYKGDKYTLGVKMNPSDGKYYIIYYSGADNYEDWIDGDVKCILQPTATPYLFKGTWFDKWKAKEEYNILFSNTGFIVDKCVTEKETYVKMYPTTQAIVKHIASSGTGFLLSNKGYIITNYHVVSNVKDGNIKVTGFDNNFNKVYRAQVEVSDKQNDLAILKVSDTTFSTLSNINYSFKFTSSNVGEDCFVLGYPLISTMGKNIKLTNGIISSKTGFDGNVAQYQISAPVQPGNSGGPLFDKNGYVIGIVQAKHTEAENAGYAIKSSYIRNLIELLPESIELPQSNSLKGKSLPQQVELASKSVCLIIVNED